MLALNTLTFLVVTFWVVVDVFKLRDVLIARVRHALKLPPLPAPAPALQCGYQSVKKPQEKIDLIYKLLKQKGRESEEALSEWEWGFLGDCTRGKTWTPRRLDKLEEILDKVQNI